MPVGAAIGASGALGAGASIYGANKQAKAAQNALSLQKQMFQTAQGALQPYYTAGANALPTLQALLTPGSSASTLASLPGFKFQSDWGTLATTNALTAMGGGLAGPNSGALAKGISDYNQGLASTYWMNDVTGLQNFTNMGAGAASALAGNSANFAGMMGNTQQNIGNAQASGVLGAANALGGAASSFGNYAFLNNALGGSGGLYGGYNAGTSNFMGLSNGGQDFLQDSGFPLP